MDDLLGLDLSRSDDTDALLLELASLDFGQTSLEQEKPPERFSTNSDLTVQQETFLANFDQVFGSTKQESDTDWNLLLPSHFLASDFVREDSSLLLMNTSSSSVPPLNASKDTEKKLTKEPTPKKVF